MAYQSICNDKLNGIIHVLDDITGWTQHSSYDFHYAYRKKVGGAYKSLFGDDLEKITSYEEGDPSLFESDLNVEMKVLLDLYPGNEEISKGNRIVIYDIETSTEGGFPDVTVGDKAITAIALYDYTTDKYYSLILDIDKKIRNKIDGNQILESFRSEELLLTSFLKIWKKLNPTIISGWNNSLFDDPYIYNRIKSVLGKQASYKLSPLGIVYQNKFNKKMTIGGISSLDYINLYKKFLGVMKSSYSLSNVAKDEELKNQKLTYKGNLDDLYKNDIERFIEYNLVDVKIVVELDKKYDFIHLAMAVCHKGHVPYEWFQMSSRWIDGAILDYLHLKNIVAPNKPLGGRETYEDMEKEGEDGFIGAYVKDPIPGLYDWVCSADITSLYPSVIMSLNISNETKISKIESWNFEAFNAGKLNEIKIGDLVYTIDEFKKMMEGNKISISSNGVIFKQDVVGVIPFILDKWFSERVEYRALAKKYLDEGIKEKSDFYSRRQLRQKIFLNSIYGVTGLPVSRWYDKDNAEAVTVSGQEIIKGAEKIVNYYFNTKTNIDKDNTIYIDTDSVYFSIESLAKLNNITPENMIQFSIDTITEISSGINKFYEYMVPKVFNINSIKNRIKIVPDVIAKKALWLAKKRYAMLKVFDMEKMRLVKDKEGNLGKIEFKGIDVVRSSFPAAFQRFASNALDMILRDIDKGVIGEKILQFEETIGSYSIVDLAKTSSARFISKDGLKNYNPKNRSQFEFVNGSPAQVRSALAYNDLLKVWKLEKQVEEIKNGSKVKWVYLLPNEYCIEQLAIKNDDTDPDKILDFIVVNIDRKKMYERELYSKLKDVYTAIGWSYPNGGSRLAEKTFDFNEEW